MSKAGTSGKKDLLFSFEPDCNETFLILKDAVEKLSDPGEASSLVLLNLWSDVLITSFWEIQILLHGLISHL